jgi:oligoendopeptidase F
MRRMKLTLKLMFMAVICTLSTVNTYSQKARTEIPDKYKWDLSGIYKSDKEWRAAKDAISGKLNEIDRKSVV